jgi:nucleotide-binding universal stress UspA family protein
MIDVKIYGTQTSNFEYLKYAILSNTTNAGIQINLQEEKSIEAFIKENIASVPAVKIKEQLIVLKHTNAVKEFAIKVVREIFQEAGFDKNSHVVVPDQYHKTSANALDYAIEIAKAMKALVKIVHFAKEPPAEVKMSEDTSIGFLDHVVLEGKLHEGLVELSADENTKLIVLGKSILSDQSSHIYGSLLAKLVNNVHSPLLMVPSEYKFKGIRKIMYAVDRDSLTKENTQFVHDLADTFGAEVHIVHVEKYSLKQDTSDWFDQHHFIQNGVNLVEQVLYGNSIFDELNNYTQQMEIDLVVLSRAKRGLMDNLFHKSITKRMVMKNPFPTVILAD